MSRLSRTTFYTVRTSRHGGFPMDMLRYDSAWPRDASDAYLIETLIKGDDAEILKLPKIVEVHLASRDPFAPCVPRWGSFLVGVTEASEG
jgi:hypothetical protein